MKNLMQPFIKKFNDNGCYYIYDVNTNLVVEVEKPVYDIIDLYGKESIEQLEVRFQNIYEPNIIKHSIDEIENAREQIGLFSDFKPIKVTMGIKTLEGLKKIHGNGLTQMVLQVTRDCNLNCGYCYTSGKYFDRSGTLPLMPIETLKKAMDFFFQRTAHKEEAYISFYGGEPLLGFQLIKEAVQYTLGKKGKTNYRFSMTTNGTLLNKEIISFLVDHDFSMLVSLDGPEYVNDRYRSYKNGGGTFQRILKNLQDIKQSYSEYYSQRVGISCVIAPPYNTLDDILDFFSKDATMKPLKRQMRSSAVDARYTTFFEDNNLKESDTLKSVEKLVKNNLKTAILNRKINELTIERRKLYNILFSLSKRPITKLLKYDPPFGNCHIGLRKLFVDVNGNFNVCERSQKQFHIGSVDEGFDFEQIVRYYQKYDELMEDCRSCWALSHCERCWATIGQLESHDNKEKEEFCSLNRNLVEKALIVYTQLLRKDPTCFEAFNDVVMDR